MPIDDPAVSHFLIQTNQQGEDSMHYITPETHYITIHNARSCLLTVATAMRWAAVIYLPYQMLCHHIRTPRGDIVL